MKNFEKNATTNGIPKKELGKQYFISVLVSLMITGGIIGAGYLIDRWRGGSPTFILIGFVISGPLSVWVIYTLVKRKYLHASPTQEQKNKQKIS